MLELPSHGRYRYVPIANRPKYGWPGNKSLAFYIRLNIEHFVFMAGSGNDPFQRTSVWRVFDARSDCLTCQR